MFLLIYINLLLVLLFAFGLYFEIPYGILYTLAFTLFFFHVSLLFSFLYFFFELIWEGKSFVPFVPTNKKVANCMIKEANLKNGQTVYDLGCGDGAILFQAAKSHNCKFIGIEKKIDVAIIAKIKSVFYKNIKIKKKDIFKEDISDADIVFLYLFPNVMKKLELKLTKECKKGTIIISNGFKFDNIIPHDSKKIGKYNIRKYIL